MSYPYDILCDTPPLSFSNTIYYESRRWIGIKPKYAGDFQGKLENMKIWTEVLILIIYMKFWKAKSHKNKELKEEKP